MSKIGFPGSPSNSASYTWRNRRKFNYNSSKGGWQTAGAKSFRPTVPTLNASTDIQDLNDATGVLAGLRGQAVLYNTVADLPAQNNGLGFAFIRETKELYFWSQPGVIGSFRVDGPYRISSITNNGGQTYIYHQHAIRNNTYMHNQSFSDYSSQYTATQPSDIGEYAVTTGNSFSDDPTTAQYITWTAPATTTYTITSTQASAVRTSASSPSARKMTYKWNVTIPTGGKLYLSGGQSGAKYWASINASTNQNNPGQNNYTGAPGGTSQILLHDPSVNTGTLLDDGNYVNVILSIPGQSHSSSQEATTISAATSIARNTTEGLYTLNKQGHNNQPVGQVHITTVGGYPRTSNYNVYYHSDYITPLNDWTGSETGTNYSFGGIAGQSGGSGGAFFIEGGLVQP